MGEEKGRGERVRSEGLAEERGGGEMEGREVRSRGEGEWRREGGGGGV